MLQLSLLTVFSTLPNTKRHQLLLGTAIQSTRTIPASQPSRGTPGWLRTGLSILVLSVLAPQLQALDDQVWFALSANGPMKEDSRLLLWFDSHARYRDGVSDLGLTIIRPGLGWRLTDRTTAWAGYARVVGRRDNGPNVEEDRAWEQLTYPVVDLLGGSLTGRTRLEQRYIDGADDTGHRLRQSVRWTRPIGASDWSWIAANEVFINLNDTDFGADTGYAQNRAYAGLSWKPVPGLGFQFTYLNNHIDNPFGDNAKNNNFTVSMSLRW